MSDFGISAHKKLNINIITQEEMNIKNYDLKKFSHCSNILKALNIKQKYSFDKLMDEFSKHGDKQYLDKLSKLKSKTKDWKIDNDYKNDYIHTHMCFNYVKKGYFKDDDYIGGAPAKIPTDLDKIFLQLKTFKEDIDVWLIKYI